MKSLLKAAVLATAGLAVAAPVALADLVIPSLSYRTGPYASNGIPVADGFADYLTLLNERDGGIGIQERTIRPRVRFRARIASAVTNTRQNR